MGAEGNGPSHQPTGATRRQAVTHPRKKYKQPKQTEEKGAIVLSLSDLAVRIFCGVVGNQHLTLRFSWVEGYGIWRWVF
jgi:hypothetical protein